MRLAHSSNRFTASLAKALFLTTWCLHCRCHLTFTLTGARSRWLMKHGARARVRVQRVVRWRYALQKECPQETQHSAQSRVRQECNKPDKRCEVMVVASQLQRTDKPNKYCQEHRPGNQ